MPLYVSVDSGRANDDQKYVIPVTISFSSSQSDWASRGVHLGKETDMAPLRQWNILSNPIKAAWTRAANLKKSKTELAMPTAPELSPFEIALEDEGVDAGIEKELLGVENENENPIPVGTGADCNNGNTSSKKVHGRTPMKTLSDLFKNTE